MNAKENNETKKNQKRATAPSAQVSRRDFLKSVFSAAALTATAAGAFMQTPDPLQREVNAGGGAVEAKFYKQADDLAG
mgnify:CR=1 FL=1